MAKRKKFGLVLDMPLTYRDTGHLNKAAKQSAEKLNQLELELRIMELFQHYGLSMPSEKLPEATVNLIISMARDLKIPGFFYKREIKRPSRPSKWGDKAGLTLALQAEIISTQNPSMALRSVLNIVKKKYGYKQPLDSLYVRYSEAVKSHYVSWWLKWYRDITTNSKLTDKEYIDFLSGALAEN